MADTEATYMRRALELAARGVGAVEPNPPVGAVIVRDGRIVAEGRHERFGGPHAEIRALADAEERGVDPRGATMYVTLEPCSHHGKTPPCADAVIEAGLDRLVAAVEDPDENVGGRGFAKLREAGVAVDVGLCEDEARELMRAYLKLRTIGRPWVIAKWAQSADGYLAPPPERGRWVSGEAARREVHALRGLCDGILVGRETARCDDPLLTNRSGSGRMPTRVVLDSRLRIDPDCRMLATLDEAPVLIATAPFASETEKADALRQRGAEVLALPGDASGLDLAALLDELGRRRWTRLLVEGGAKVLGGFIFTGLADELRVYVGTERYGQNQPIARFDYLELPRREYRKRSERSVGEDRCIEFRRDR